MSKKFGKDEDLLELGKFYFINKKFNDAIEILKKAFDLNSADDEIAYNLGLCYEAINDTDKAKFYYKKTLYLNKEHKLASEHLHKIVGEY